MKTPERSITELTEGAVEFEPDRVYENAVVRVRHCRRCSLAWLQRKYGIGRKMAAQIITEMVRRGIVGP